MKTFKWFVLNIFIVLSLASCKNDNDLQIPNNPNDAAKAVIDRFSEQHGTLMVRTSENSLPEANTPINFDLDPFITQSFGPNGEIVRYYNFDVQALTPAPIYVLFKAGENTPVQNQLNIIDVIPGDVTYSDFWQIYKVTVSADYVANTVSSFQEIRDKNYPIEQTTSIVNCPVVPYGSKAISSVSGNENSLHSGWYKQQVVYYFTFNEKDLTISTNNLVPFSPIYVTFNSNPDESNPNSGPASGFVTEAGSNQTHNVIATLPADADYSPLWSVYVYNNEYFEQVFDLNSVKASEILMENAMYVNCPVVYIKE